MYSGDEAHKRLHLLKESIFFEIAAKIIEIIYFNFKPISQHFPFSRKETHSGENTHRKVYMVQHAIFGKFCQNVWNLQNFDFALIFYEIHHISC